MILDRAAARKLADRVLKLATSKDVVVSVGGGHSANTRFANNEITSCGDSDRVHVSVAAAFGRRHASASTNQIDDVSLRTVVETAEEMARLAPEDPEHMPALALQKIGDAPARDARTAALLAGPDSAGWRQKGVEACLGPALAKKLVAAGFFQSSDEFSTVATSAGGFGYHASTDASFSATVRTPDGSGSGWADASAWKAGDVDWAAVGRRAVEKAELSAKPRRLDPGRYTVVLEPEAVAGILGAMRGALGARPADEGRSFFSKPGGGTRVGEKIFSDKITLVSDPRDPLLPARPFDGDGLALAPRTWIDKGVLREMVYNRFWAKKQGHEPTGQPPNLILRGGGSTLAEMVKSVAKGILVTRFWYIRSVDPRTLLVTGLTRDGTFWIEKGEIAYPVNNFRFNESPATLLANVEMLSTPVRASERFACPAIKASGFNMASISAAV